MIDFHKSNTDSPRILLTSVFGPYAQDDEYGSRRINPMELYHNQVTRTQGPFSLRMFHRSWGLMLIQSNIDAPCTLLDFPTLDRFIEELQTQEYDVIGISSIIPNTKKVEKMCRLIRRYQPNAKIVIGGHITNVPDLGERLDADHIVRGDGVRWFREYLGEDPSRPINHPLITTRFGTRTAGINVDEGSGGDRRDDHSFRRLSDGLQLLLDVGHVRREGEVRQLLRDGGRTVRHHVQGRGRDGRLVLLHYGRELPSLPRADVAALRTDGGA